MSEKYGLPSLNGRQATRERIKSTLLLALTAFALILISRWIYVPVAPSNAQEILLQCRSLKAKPGPPPNFHKREISDRYEEGTNPVLITNATIWTGGRYGTEVVYGDLLMHGGVIKAVGYIPKRLLDMHEPGKLIEINAKTAWVTPGLFDLHSHVGLLSAPLLSGAFDVNSPNGPVIPWLRSLDALNTRDDAYALTVAGGVTGGLILPGSGNAIGGQAFPIKYRRTPQRTPSSMVIEPPFNLNGSYFQDPKAPLRWRHMKHATGENQIRYGTRMDSTWAFRGAYDKARQVKNAQDSFCEKAEAGLWNDPQIKGNDFPFDLQWEALVDVLRGRVKVNCHTYETEDIDFLQRLTNEFKFPLAAIHHAHEAYLVPSTLKSMWGGPPMVATFALHARYKRESYRGSEFAPRILADNGIDVVLKSDHPVLDSRYLLFEAQQAHFYSLPTNLALRSVITAPAIAAGLSHRIGTISEGYDADVVIWDSHPLTLGATPKQVFIDGIAQLKPPHPLNYKGEVFQRPPQTPNWSQEIEETLRADGLPNLRPWISSKNVHFANVSAVYRRQGLTISNTVSSGQSTSNKPHVSVLVTNGRISCIGHACDADHLVGYESLDLKGGVIGIGLTTFGSPLGLSEISGEPSTSDGGHRDPLSDSMPAILHDPAGSTDSVDALQFNGRDTLYAYRFGVVNAISSVIPAGGLVPGVGTFYGTSVAFRTGARHGLEDDAIIKTRAALHLAVHHNFARNGAAPSVSAQVASIRSMLLGNGSGRSAELFESVAQGELPLVVNVDNADIMITLIKIKREVESRTGKNMMLTFSGAGEAHLVANEIAAANVNVIVNPAHSYPGFWDSKRILAGPPLTKETAITTLLSRNITVALGSADNALARNALLHVAWAALDSEEGIAEEDALAMASTNFNKIFDIKSDDMELDDLVAYQGGGIFNLESKVVAIISPRSGAVDIL